VSSGHAMNALLNGTFGGGARLEKRFLVYYGDIVRCLDYSNSFAS